MKLSASQKKILMQKVHCTHYLKKDAGIYILEHNEQDNNWYYRNYFHEDKIDGKATENPNSWKHNVKFELAEKEFEGIVVKIENLLLSTTLGVYKKDRDCIEACDYAPQKNNGCSVLAATVFFRNGCKRYVPLDCIVEYEGFTNGKETEKVLSNLNEFINSEPNINVITVNDDGSIEIENTYPCLNPETAELVYLKKYLILDVKNRTARTISEEDYEWFDISDEDYFKIMDIMNQQMKEECGFIPDISYGETNFNRLINFSNFPFAPELNEFSHLFNYDEPSSYEEYLFYSTLEDSLKYNQAAVSEFIKICGLPYTPKNNKIFLQGHRVFLEYLGIWNAGFRDENIVERIIAADEHKIFAATLNNATLELKFDDTDYEKRNEKTCLCFTDKPDLFFDISNLFRIYDERTAGKLTIELISKTKSYSTPDALDYLINLNYENLLTKDIIRKIGKEGFTEYNHNLLMQIYRDAHPDFDESVVNQEIKYEEIEQNLVWENSGYHFCLPEDTNRLVDIGAKMNICVGHLYRDKAASKRCTIVYAKKDNLYELCIEVQKSENNRFRMIQKSAFNNNAPKGKLLEVFNQWCRVKGVC